MSRKLALLDIFSGIGGFSLGLERSGFFRTVAFCEIEPFPRRVLKKHWPDVPIYEDVRLLTADALRRDGIIDGADEAEAVADANGQRCESSRHGVARFTSDATSKHRSIDAICGGFPCQDISLAGKGAGLAGTRSGLWFEYARIIGELRPKVVIVENVAALLGRGLDRVLGDLAALGFDAEWHCIPASAVGAPHRRDRLWIVANRQCEGLEGFNSEILIERDRGRSSDDARSGSPSMADAEGDRCRAGWKGGSDRLGEGIRQRPLSDANCQPTIGAAISWRECGQWLSEPDVGRVVARLSTRMDGGRLDADAPQGGTEEILQAVRDGFSAPFIQWPSRGFGGLQETEILLSFLCEYEGPPKPLGNVSLEGEEASRAIVRGVWFDGKSACPSCRRSAQEQRAHQHPDLVRLLSQLLACDCGSAWLDPAGTPSETSRVDRLKGLGNAVVPQIPELIGRAIGAAMRAELAS